MVVVVNVNALPLLLLLCCSNVNSNVILLVTGLVIHGCSTVALYGQITRKSPEMLAPARIPVAAGKKIAKTVKNVSPSRKSGAKLAMNIFSVKVIEKK